MKKYLIYIAVFIVVLLFSFVLFFPYQEITSYVIKKNFKDIEYESISGNSFYTNIKGISINNYKIGDVTFTHNLFNLILLKSKLTGDILNLNLNGYITLKSAVFKLDGNLSNLEFKLGENTFKIPQVAANVDGSYNIKEDILQADVTLNNAVLNFLNQDYKIERTVVQTTFNKNRLNIKTIDTAGKTKFNFDGDILINFRNPYYSRLNLKLLISDGQLNLAPKVSGTISNPRVEF